jgi:cytochrome c peroxidase
MDQKPFYADDFTNAPSVSAMTALGRVLFRDPSLSGSGRVSCASCHSPEHDFGPPNNLPVQRGGMSGHEPGLRAVPSLKYQQNVPTFTEHFFDDDGDDSVDQGPAGGRTWDGRVNRPRDQAAIPLLAPNEMANISEAAVVARAARAPYAARMRELYGATVFADTHRAFSAIGEALEAFQESPELFSPYTSKYDAFLRGQVALSEQEARGLAAFNDPAKGNCARCHKSQLTPARNLPKFTDFGFVAIGVPRNPAIPANADPNYYDLGACGPLRRDLADRPEYCGMFKAPTLRNVAVRRSFYHNGIFHTLEEAVAFYATRDTNPERWYPRSVDGQVQKFDDLPSQYRANIDVEPPFDRKPGDVPALSDEDVADVVAFLRTLTDGFTPPVLRARQTANAAANQSFFVR